jgi:undecaprenyl diphosphate synthase
MINKKELLNSEPVPRHIGIIMDGNGRWAKQRNISRSEGHKSGAEVIEPLTDCAIELGIKAVSLYALSVDNIKIRPISEIRALWNLLEYFFSNKLDSIKEKNIQIRHSGSISKLPPSTRKTIKKAVEETSGNRGLILNFCVNYSGRQEIIQAVNEWSSKIKPGEKLTEKKLEKYLYTSGMPDLDLLIRTSGEYRISNFFLWQIAYAELVFTDVLWPDFKPEDLINAVAEYQKRERRYGGL